MVVFSAKAKCFNTLNTNPKNYVKFTPPYSSVMLSRELECKIIFSLKVLKNAVIIFSLKNYLFIEGVKKCSSKPKPR